MSGMYLRFEIKSKVVMQLVRCKDEYHALIYIFLPTFLVYRIICSYQNMLKYMEKIYLHIER